MNLTVGFGAPAPHSCEPGLEISAPAAERALQQSGVILPDTDVMTIYTATLRSSSCRPFAVARTCSSINVGSIA